MPRAERGTPKDIANRIKAKGLQKLRWYCQSCQKQCRDANGFKCHLTSESHIRQMKLFGQQAGKMVYRYSLEFEKVYLDILRRRHGTLKMNANRVYQEVIQDKHHVHMNATRWQSLAGFVRYLGASGKCHVEETERGWLVQYIERDPFLLERQEKAKRRAEAERIEEMKQMERMQVQRVEAAKALDLAGATISTEASNIDTLNKKSVSISLSSMKTASQVGSAATESVFECEDDFCQEIKEQHEKKEVPKEKRKIPAISSPPRKKLRYENWLHTGILVKIMSKVSDGAYYKRKGIVDQVLNNGFTAIVCVLDSSSSIQDGGDIIQIDQDDLRTVVPSKIGKKVKIVNGKHRGSFATIVVLDDKKQCAELKIENDEIIQVLYDDFSKAE